MSISTSAKVSTGDERSQFFGRRVAHRSRAFESKLTALAITVLFVLSANFILWTHSTAGRLRTSRIPANVASIRARCDSLKLKPGPPANFYERRTSDRAVPGTAPLLITNATIWTGENNGKDVINGDVLLADGMIKFVGDDFTRSLDHSSQSSIKLKELDVKGAWVTPGIVDLHSHLGVGSSPSLSGASDTNSRHGITQPWLRALDGLNTHDDAYRLSVSGGVTTALVLPGSANDIGGQAFTIKLRPTEERTPTSLLLEPPFTLNNSDRINWTERPRWRQMKHACGENPRRVYGNTRMDNIWAFREIYNKAKQIRDKQDDFCAKVESEDFESLGPFPDELQYEAIVDILRGRVKVQVHCYEAVDLDDIVRLTNEFEFPIAAFHHAHETYLVPDLLKKAYGNTPASAMFATNARYKREAYRGSEFASRILAEHGISVVMKSDHPVLDSRHLVFEAQQAHYYGLSANLALASVTSTPARIMGMDHRVGLIKEGYDADVVIWDSHPLALGATPQQVFIDGVAQLDGQYVSVKQDALQKVPRVPDFSQEASDAVLYEGLPPLDPHKSAKGLIIFTNAASIAFRGDGEDLVQFDFEKDSIAGLGELVAKEGNTVCYGAKGSCASYLLDMSAEVVDLKGGSILPALVSFGSPLGLEEIQGEVSTRDGYVLDTLAQGSPTLLQNKLIRAADGLRFATRHAYVAYRHGVSVGIASPLSAGLVNGVSVAFGLGSVHKLEKGAILQDAVAVHVSVGHDAADESVSAQIALLRELLLKDDSPLREVTKGDMTLVVHAESADIIATVISLKSEVEKSISTTMKLTISGGAEAHLLARDLAEANVGVIVNPSRQFPTGWEQRRILPGPPLTGKSAISLLLSHNVTVGIGSAESWQVRNLRFDAGWAALESEGQISRREALALVSTNVEKLLGFKASGSSVDLVAVESGDLFNFEGKVVGMVSPRRGVVDLF